LITLRTNREMRMVTNEEAKQLKINYRASVLIEQNSSQQYPENPVDPVKKKQLHSDHKDLRRTLVFRRFTRDVFVVSLVVSVLLIGFVAYLASQARRTISERYIHDASKRAAIEFLNLTDRVEASLGMARDWGTSGLIDLSNTEKLKGLFFPFFGKNKLLSGITIADTGGRSYLVLPDGSERKPSEAEGFNPQERPWFAPALEGEGVSWSKQYLFHTLKRIGITASISYVPEKGKKPGVVAFDVLLDDLYRAIDNMVPSKNSDLFIFRDDELLLLSEAVAADSSFIPFGTVTNPLIRDAHVLWKGGQLSENEVVSLTHNGKVWWCGFHPLEGARENVWMGVIMPESDIVGDISRRRTFLWAFGLAALLVSIGVPLWLSRRYGRSLSAGDAFGSDASEENVRMLIEKGENRSVEFKSTMRMNLHTKKPGKEIELAWLKGIAAFLNTDGGTLLLGVTDAGEITGLERDVFENEDKCRLHFKNLVATHIGAEMSKYIRLLLLTIDDKTVGVVHCSHSLEPIFLKDGNKEAFYIRNGPSSDELPVSKALKYIKHRK